MTHSLPPPRSSDLATLFDPPAGVLPATSQDDAADGSWMIGAVDDSVFGQLAACPDIGERRDIAVEHARASEDQKDRRREVLPLLDADVRCLLQLIDAPRPGAPGVLGDLVADIAIEARSRIATDGADGGHPVQLRPQIGRAHV